MHPFRWSHHAWGLLVAVPWVSVAGCSCPVSYHEMKLTPDGLALVHTAPDGAKLSAEQCQALCEGRAHSQQEGVSSVRTGMHWSCELDRGDQGAVVECHGAMECIGGRRPQDADLVDTTREERYFASAAALEGASVVAFIELAESLASHGAPEPLVRRALRAAREEVGHARTTAAFARREGFEPDPVVLTRNEVPTLEVLATLNAREGCAAELFAAKVARHQARHASKRTVRDALGVIAREEASHAALSFDVHAWAVRKLDRASRRRVAEARDARQSELVVASEREVSRAHRSELGWPSAERAVEIARALPRLV